MGTEITLKAFLNFPKGNFRLLLTVHRKSDRHLFRHFIIRSIIIYCAAIIIIIIYSI